MALNFTTTSQAAVVHGVKMLVYGQAGMGKTCLAATAPAPIILSAESGLLSLSRANIERLYGVNSPNVTYDIPVINITTVDDLIESYNWFLRSKDATQFQTIYIDSLSEIGEVVLANAKKQVKDKRQAYGELIEQIDNAIRLFRDLAGRHVVMTAKLEVYKDEFSGVTKNGPSMPGAKMGYKIPYLYDEVFRLGINKAPDGSEYRFLQTQPDFQHDAKDRSGALDPVEYPNLTHVINKILGATNAT